jgi:hypothetical protein
MTHVTSNAGPQVDWLAGLKAGCRPTQAWARSVLKANPHNRHLIPPYEQRSLTFPSEWSKRLKANRQLGDGNCVTSVWDMAYLQVLRGYIAEAGGPAPILANPEEFIADLCRANGRRTKAGVLTLEETLQFGLALFPAVTSEVLILMAPPIRSHRPVGQVTCAVLMKLPDEKVLGYATALPKWHPLLGGNISQGLQYYEMECFFPEADQRWDEYHSQLRAQAFAPEAKPTQSLETNLQLV